MDQHSLAYRAPLRFERPTCRRAWMREDRADVIVGVSNDKVDDFADLYAPLDQRHAGDKVDVKICRQGDVTTAHGRS